MKATGVMIALLVLAACGQAQGSPTSSTHSVTSGPPLIAMLQADGTANPWTYNTVAIAGLDGSVTAKATFAPMPVPNAGCMGAIIPQSAHVAAGKVLYADAKGVIRSLSIDGTVATVATFPLTSTQQMLSFAVSPDGSMLLGTVYTIPLKAFTCDGTTSTTEFAFDAYSATSGGSSILLYHQTWSKPQDVMALTGWDAVGPIGTYPTVWASQGGGPGSTLGVIVRIDAATLKPEAPLSDPSSCVVWSSVSSGAFVCTKDPVVTGEGADRKVTQPVSIRQAGGSELWQFTLTSTNGGESPVLSPDGRRVTICCADVSSGFSYVMVGHDGSQRNLASGFYADGWVDSTTVIGVSNIDPLKQPPFPMAYAAADTPSAVIARDLFGNFVGTVRA